MNPELSDEAVAFGRSVAGALEAAGGDALLARAEADPSQREALVAPVLDALGAWDLDAAGSADELEAAAALCRAAGWWGAPYPVAERLTGVIVVDERRPRAAVGGLDTDWGTVTLSGRLGRATARPLETSARKSAFVTDLDVSPVDGDGRPAVATALVLPCWTLLGMLDRAVEVTAAYVQERRQFGQELSSFQGVQFQLTDAEVERTGLEELAKHALWSLRATPDDAVADALALRLAAIDAAEVVFRVAHQLHGAIGFCDETVVSWLSRHSQPLRRLPFGASGTREALVAELGRRPLRGLFDADYARADLAR